MRRRVLPLAVLLAACSGSEPLRIGVTVSGSPSNAAVIAAAALQSPEMPPFDTWVWRGAASTGADTAIAVAERFAADPSVIAVIGHSNSAASLAASQVYNRAGLVQIAPTTTSTTYRDAGPYSFRMVPGDDWQAKFLASRGQTGWPPAQRIAVVYVNDDYGRSFYRELRPRLEDVVYEGMYAELADTMHLVGLGGEIAGNAPDLLIWLGRPQRLRVVLQRLRAELPALRVLCGDACDEASVHANQGGAYDGLRFTRFVDPQADSPGLAGFRSSYAGTTGQAPTAEAVLTYDAVLAVAAALKDGARSREQVRRFLMSLGRGRPPLDGLGGPIAFDDNGDLIRSYLLADVTAAGVRAVPVPEP